MAQSLAERFRKSREAFVLARELDCTPAEAAAELARRQARERWEATERRLQAKMAAPCASAVAISGHDPEEPRGNWWED